MTTQENIDVRPWPFAPRYVVSKDGRVFNCFGRFDRSGQGIAINPPREMARSLGTTTGYWTTTVMVAGKQHKLNVHRMVLEAWVGECPAGMQCHQEDGVRSNCHLTNLSWKTNEAEPIEDRLLNSSFVDASGCWLWCLGKNSHGYGRITVPGVRYVEAHVVSYNAFKGEIPEGLELDHLCRVRHCINPNHLEPVTHAENMRRSAAAFTHCPNGHAYTPENVYLYKGSRNCRTCTRIGVAKYNAKKRAAKANNELAKLI